MQEDQGGLPLIAPPFAPSKSAASSERLPADLPSHTGHRQRLRDRFMRAGSDALADYEMLELVLFRAIPRRDVKPLAKALLARFNDFEGVLSAPPERLAEIGGLSLGAITELKIVAAAAVRLSQAKAHGRPVLSSWSAMMNYCNALMSRLEAEQFRVFFLDKKNQLMGDEVLNEGSIDQVAVYPRVVAKRALDMNAASIILAHNHPSGDPTPSQADIIMTRKIVQACRSLDVKVLDHVIIGREFNASFQQLGLELEG